MFLDWAKIIGPLIGVILSALLVRSSSATRTLARGKTELEAAALLPDKNHRQYREMMKRAHDTLWLYQYLRKHTLVRWLRALNLWLWSLLLMTVLAHNIVSRSNLVTGPNKEIWLRFDSYTLPATQVLLIAVGGLTFYIPFMWDPEYRAERRARRWEVFRGFAHRVIGMQMNMTVAFLQVVLFLFPKTRVRVTTAMRNYEKRLFMT